MTTLSGVPAGRPVRFTMNDYPDLAVERPHERHFPRALARRSA
jgi:hypothetical protein